MTRAKAQDMARQHERQRMTGQRGGEEKIKRKNRRNGKGMIRAIKKDDTKKKEKLTASDLMIKRVTHGLDEKTEQSLRTEEKGPGRKELSNENYMQFI